MRSLSGLRIPGPVSFHDAIMMFQPQFRMATSVIKQPQLDSKNGEKGEKSPRLSCRTVTQLSIPACIPAMRSMDGIHTVGGRRRRSGASRTSLFSITSSPPSIQFAWRRSEVAGFCSKAAAIAHSLVTLNSEWSASTSRGSVLPSGNSNATN
jgi:hypothetical protein